MKTRKNIYKLTLSAILIAIGILIPMISPLKLILEPASFTLASHVPIFIGMFISPSVAAAVALGTTAGFFLGGFPIVVTLRALTHVIFVIIGSQLLKKRPSLIQEKGRSLLFSFIIGIIHAVSEIAVVSLFYFAGGMTEGYYAQGFMTSVLLLVGVGTVIHSMVDFSIAQVIWLGLEKRTNVSKKISHIQ
ncbi:hypothetical protein JTF06_02995 [Desemzia sp. RIT804]|uniref:hypothetical protein n=1 Tax=Desemzia sp. RIT 804 TaxID=2810209 RepID=UPI001951BD02|nr:hypothetical protein [Desemzia sp. RIT 804]MBM6613861.1 hypothetical protein [Desemzia sp. RIT 804]